MPDDKLTDAIKEAWAVAKSNVATLECIEVSHSLGGVFYLVNNTEYLTFTHEDATSHDYEPVPFRLQRPKQGETGSQELSLTIDNVDQRISDFVTAIKNSQEGAVVRYRYYLSNDLTTPGRTAPLELTIVEGSMGLLDATFRCRFVDVVNQEFPNERYTRQRFPGLGG